MNRLSTEIDENIAQRLDKKDLSALLKTSRYHRTIAEPYLYGELTFSDQQHASISLLFNTILNRRELAGRIRSFTLTDKEHTNTFPRTHSPTSLWPRLAEVKLLLEEFVPLLSSSSSRLLAKQWLQQLLAYAPVIDGKVAMIICLAKEINDITLSTNLSEMPITRIVIGWPWIEVDAIAEEDHLTSLTLEIYDSTTYHTQLDVPFTRHSSPPLTDTTDNGKKEGEQAIQRRDTYRMKQMDDRNAPCPFYKLKRLSIHDPKSLGYETIPRYGYARRLFFSLKQLCSLTTLTMDDELINSRDLNNRSLLIHLLTSQVLPTSLQSLSITSIYCMRLAQLCRKHTKGDEQDAAIKRIVNAVTALRLESLELHTKAAWHMLWADYMTERDESIHRVVPVMIDAMSRCGTTMRVWHQGVSGQTLWYEPGFAVAEQDWC